MDAPVRQASARALTRSAEAHSRPPAAPTWRPAASHAATVQRRGDLPKRLRPGGLGLANCGRNAVGEGVGASGMVCVGDGARRVEARVAEGLSAGLGGGQGGNRALADHRALALGKGGVKVQHERLDVRPDSATTNGTRWAIKPEMK